MRPSNLDIFDSGNVINLQIGNYCSISGDSYFIFNRNHDYLSVATSTLVSTEGREGYVLKQKGQILIGHDVWCGRGITVLADVKIGHGAVIGAGAIVGQRYTALRR